MADLTPRYVVAIWRDEWPWLILQHFTDRAMALGLLTDLTHNDSQPPITAIDVIGIYPHENLMTGDVIVQYALLRTWTR